MLVTVEAILKVCVGSNNDSSHLMRRYQELSGLVRRRNCSLLCGNLTRPNQLCTRDSSNRALRCLSNSFFSSACLVQVSPSSFATFAGTLRNLNTQPPTGPPGLQTELKLDYDTDYPTATRGNPANIPSCTPAAHLPTTTPALFHRSSLRFSRLPRFIAPLVLLPVMPLVLLWPRCRVLAVVAQLLRAAHLPGQVSESI